MGGSTNTLAALKLALSDELCEAIYLLTDGRPDQVSANLCYFGRVNTPPPPDEISRLR